MKMAEKVVSRVKMYIFWHSARSVYREKQEHCNTMPVCKEHTHIIVLPHRKYS
jgi:hypothetical protein